jgi:hypothetical protein
MKNSNMVILTILLGVTGMSGLFSVMGQSNDSVVTISTEEYMDLVNKRELYNNLALDVDMCDTNHKSKCSLHALPMSEDSDNLLVLINEIQ